MKRLSFFLLVGALALRTVAAASFPVTTSADSGPDSLRQAITDANGTAGTDTITFNIHGSDPNCDPTSDVCTITPTSALPAITDPVTINGYTQPGASANTLALGDNAILLIELNGASANSTGLTLGGTSGGSTITGLVINRFVNGSSDAAIRVVSSNNVVTGCFIGVDPTGNTKLANSGGVRVVTGANNRIGGTTPAARNIISGNNPSTNSSGGSNNIAVTFDPPYPPALPLPTGTIIRGNYIGTNAAGTASISDPLVFGATDGIVISGGTGTIIGGTDADDGATDGKVGARNVISGNLVGISTRFGIYNGTVTVQGNFIGVNAAGTAALGNYYEGINFSPYPQDGSTFTTNSITIGGTAAGAANVISGQTYGAGVYTNARVVIVQGNRIGTDLGGTLDLGNGGSGFELYSPFPAYPDAQATIGGATSAARNIISANGNDNGGGGHGLVLASAGSNTVQGNFIGTKADGVSALGNRFNGILVNGSSKAVTIGGANAGEGNVLAFNYQGAAVSAQGGIVVDSQFSTPTGIAILGNSIYSNGGPGIDLGGNGITPNDTGDGDTGANNLQNFPVLTSIVESNGNAEVVGTLDSQSSTTYRVEFFGNDEIDPLKYGEGKTFLGSTDVATDASGHAAFDVTFPLLPGALHVTSTATDPNGNTSEFSQSVGQLLNISTRLRVLTGDNVLIGGFILLGPDAKRVIIRGLGPSLSSQGVPGPLADPTLELHAGDGTLIASNDNWKSDNQAEIEATTIPPSDDLESAIVATLPADGSAYTAIVRGKNGTTGVGLVETYDLDTAANSKLANISTRGFVDTADNVLIGGFILGDGSARVIARAIGPSLTDVGVAGALQDPTLELHDGFGTLVASNDNWKTDQQAEIIATGVAPTKDLESAIVATLLPGNYTAIVRGKNDTTGVGLVEVYNLN